MKLIKTVGWIVVLAAGQVWAAEPPVLKTDKDRLSYAIGASVGKNLKNEGTEIDLAMLVEGIKANLAGDKLALTDREVRQVMNDYQTQMRQRAGVKRQLAMADNKKAGDAFLAAYKAKAGVQVMSTGVMFEVLKEGAGKKPVETDTVVVNYRGSLVNNTEFDSTAPGKPAELKVASLITGWKQALAIMPVGSKWHVVIPSHLAYGERGVGNDIGPNEVLVFDVELLAIK